MRGKQAKKREVEKDAVYGSKVVTKFINNVMKSGKKTVAERIVYDSLEKLGKELKGKPLEILEEAIENVSPKVEIRPRRVGGVNYQVPMPVPDYRQRTLAMKWIIEGARNRRGSDTFRKALTSELKDAFNEAGHAFKKKEDTHKMAEANKAFAHFQW